MKVDFSHIVYTTLLISAPLGLGYPIFIARKNSQYWNECRIFFHSLSGSYRIDWQDEYCGILDQHEIEATLYIVRSARPSVSDGGGIEFIAFETDDDMAMFVLASPPDILKEKVDPLEKSVDNANHLG